MLENVTFIAAIIAASLTIFLLLQLTSAGHRRQATYGAMIAALGALIAINIGDEQFSFAWVREAKYQSDGVALVLITASLVYGSTYVNYMRQAGLLHLTGGAIVGATSILGGLATLGVTRNSEELAFASIVVPAALLILTGFAGLSVPQRHINTRIVFGALAAFGGCQIIVTLILLAMWKSAA